MAKTETRKLREGLTEEQKAEALRIGDLSFKSQGRDPFCRKMSIRVKYAGVGHPGRVA